MCVYIVSYTYVGRMFQRHSDIQLTFSTIISFSNAVSTLSTLFMLFDNDESSVH